MKVIIFVECNFFVAQFVYLKNISEFYEFYNLQEQWTTCNVQAQLISHWS